MKLYIFIYLFCTTIFTKGAPNYEQSLQTRNLGDWFYLGDTNKTVTEDNDSANSSLQPHYTSHFDPEQLNSKGTYNTTNDNASDATKVIPVGKVGLDDKPEPIENLLDELKKKTNNESINSKSVSEEDKNIISLLKDLNKTITDTPSKLAKVFVNKTWRIFDIGTLGSTRRTRNVEKSNDLLSYFDFFGWFTYFFNPVSSHGTITQGNTAIYPESPSHRDSSKGSNSQSVQSKRQNSSNKNLTVNEENKSKATNFFDSDTPEEILSKVTESLEKNNLNTEEKFYIILVLDQLYDYSYQFENETKIQLNWLIIDVGEDRRFDEIYEILKSSEKRDDRDLWNFFRNSRSALMNRIRSFQSEIREKEVTKEPLTDNCFITGPPKEVSEQGTGDEKVTLITYHTLHPESEDNHYKFCIEDNSEAEADKLLMLRTDESFDETLFSIKSLLNRISLMGTEYKWLVIFKLYKMHEKLSIDREDDKKKILKVMTQVGNDRHFVRMFESLKAAKDSRFHKIWESFKNNSEKEDEKSSLRALFGHYL